MARLPATSRSLFARSPHRVADVAMTPGGTMSDHHPDDAPGRPRGSVMAEVVTLVLVLALVVFVAGFVLLLPLLLGDF